MTWESVIGGALQGISTFVNTIGSVLNSDALEGILVLGAISVIYSIFQGDTKIRIPKLPKLRRKDDEDDYEYVRVRRR